VCTEGATRSSYQGQSPSGGAQLFGQRIEIQKDGLQRFTFIKSCGCSSFDVPGKEEVEAGPTIDGDSSESPGNSVCQQYQLVEDCSFWSFVILRFCLSTLVGFLSTGEHLDRPMWGSGFGGGRDIKA
jgi:hypothetical protein